MANAPSSAQLKALHNQIVQTANTLQRMRKFLQSKCDEVSVQWRDEKAIRLSILVQQCVQEISKVVRQLRATAEFLRRLYQAVRQYEEVVLSQGGSIAAAPSASAAPEPAATPPPTYDASGNYIGSHRKYRMQSSAARRDYETWQASGGSRLPYTDLVRQHADYQSVVAAQDVFDVFDADRSDFWTYKKRPKEDYIQMASHIPLVQAYLEEGKTLEEVIDMGGTVGACAYQYFADPVRVMRAGSSYLHTSFGRHRTIAAQLAHVELPVRVVGTYTSLE